MEHRAGKGRFTVAAKEGSKRRVVRGEDNAFPELDEPTNFLDLVLADHPADADEASQGGISRTRTAAMVPPGGLYKGFEKEAAELAAGIKKYGSLEEYQKHMFEGSDFFSGYDPAQQWTPGIGSVPAPEGGYFESHIGSEGIHRTVVTKKSDVTFDASDDSDAKKRAKAASTGQVLDVHYKPAPNAGLRPVIPHPIPQVSNLPPEKGGPERPKGDRRGIDPKVIAVVPVNSVAPYVPSKKVKLDFDF